MTNGDGAGFEFYVCREDDTPIRAAKACGLLADSSAHHTYHDAAAAIVAQVTCLVRAGGDLGASWGMESPSPRV
jgi:hypothetical protein